VVKKNDKYFVSRGVGRVYGAEIRLLL